MSARKAVRRPRAQKTPKEFRLSPTVQRALDEEFGADMRFARAALMTAILAVNGGESVYRHLGTSLRVHVYNTLSRLERRLTGQELMP